MLMGASRKLVFNVSDLDFMRSNAVLSKKLK